MDKIRLCFRGCPVAEYVITERSLEVGRAPGCDIVVADAAVGPRALLIRRERGVIVAYDLAAPTRGMKPRVVGHASEMRLGREHTLVRVPCRGEDGRLDAKPKDDGEPGTARLAGPDRPRTVFRVGIGQGSDRRAVVVDRPTRVGSAPDNDLVVLDRAVSTRHLLLEPVGHGILVRDLGSTNGTYVDGTRVHAVELDRAACIAIGRTQLRLVHDAAEADFVAVSSAYRDAVATAERAARLPFPVLLHGESGVGKEALARRIHEASPRAAARYVAWNAGSLEPTFVESQLFGHVAGAFTGAVGRHVGAFEQADGGTLFLDEVGELPISVQARLLRVLETGELRPLGGDKPRRVDVRLVAATHRDLRQLVGQGGFRADLYYRLAQLVVRVPPLRERPEDIVPTAERLLERDAEWLGRRTLSADARIVLRRHLWFGNARELRNVLRAASASCGGPELSADAVQRAIRELAHVTTTASSDVSIASALELCGGKVARAARVLGVPRSTLRDAIKRSRASRVDSEHASDESLG